jgi:nitrate reductase gamma subunit
MEWYKLFALAAMAICFASLLYHLFRVISSGEPRDFSQATGNPKAAMPYAFIGAMSPTKKESAFLHLPTYVAGMIYHMGTFLSLTIFFIILLNFNLPTSISWLLAGTFVVSGICGFGILIKRMVKSQLRQLSNADDYVANFLVSFFQIITALTLLSGTLLPLYFIMAGILFLYIPVGKLKHTVYFFAARYHLGFFFGRRNVWPPRKS